MLSGSIMYSQHVSKPNITDVGLFEPIGANKSQRTCQEVPNDIKPLPFYEASNILITYSYKYSDDRKVDLYHFDSC